MSQAKVINLAYGTVALQHTSSAGLQAEGSHDGKGETLRITLAALLQPSALPTENALQSATCDNNSRRVCHIRPQNHPSSVHG